MRRCVGGVVLMGRVPCFSDSGETDWKVLCINVKDPMAKFLQGTARAVLCVYACSHTVTRTLCVHVARTPCSPTHTQMSRTYRVTCREP